MKKNNMKKILIIFLLLSPFIDLICGFFVRNNIFITIGTIIRSVFLLFIILYTLLKYKNKFYISYLGLILIYFILFFMINDFSNNFIWLSKIFYFPTILYSIYVINQNENLNISNKYIILYLLSYCIFLLLGDIIANINSYEIAKLGEVGWFNSANEIGAIISICLPFLCYYCFKNINIIKILLLLGVTVAILLMGTKTPLLFLILCLAIYFIKYLMKVYKKSIKKGNKIILSILIIGLLCIFFILPKTYIYENTLIHLKYLHIEKFSDLLDLKILDHFIFGRRFTFLSNTNKIFISQNIFKIFCGLGFTTINKTIEMDLFDIFYHLGIIGFIIFIIPLIIVLKNKKKNNLEINLSLIILILTSCLTGHVLVAPSVSFLCVIIILKSINKDKKDILFIAKDLNMGGIETALVNLLNKLNYDKYNVDLVLEKKDGVLLPKLNINVNIINYNLSNNKNIFIRKIINLIKRFTWVIFNYKQYDFSCCYTTYSFLGEKLSKVSSDNNSIYVHSNYKQVYKNEKDFKKFFEDRKVSEFKNIIFVSNEAKNSFLDTYKNLKNKAIVINNFIDVNKIIDFSKKKVKEKKQNKTLFVFVGRLDDSSKKLGRAIKLIKNLDDAGLWIIGNGPDKEKYIEEVKKYKLDDKIKFLVETTNPFPYIKLADYLLITSDYEGFPMTFLEAIVLNKPIISTINVSDELINIEKDFGYIISKDEKEMTKEVKNILKNSLKTKKIDFNLIQEKRMKKLEKIIDEV